MPSCVALWASEGPFHERGDACTARAAAVAAAGGRDAVKLIWVGPENLPSEEEFADPQRWLQRVSPQSFAASA